MQSITREKSGEQSALSESHTSYLFLQAVRNWWIMIILSEPDKLPDIDFIIRSEMPQHCLKNWYVCMLNTGIQGSLGHLLA